jgi:hypothetical protein
MSAQPLPALATVAEIVDLLNSAHDRAQLIATLAPLKLPNGLSDHERALIVSALIAAASRCWRQRSRP